MAGFLRSPFFQAPISLFSPFPDVYKRQEPERKDECCGFGGMFAVEEDAVSVQMGHDKVIPSAFTVTVPVYFPALVP